MKRYLLFYFVLISSKVYCLKNHHSKSFLITRPAYFNIEAYTAGWHNMAYDCGDKITSYQFITYFQRSSANNSRSKNKRLGEYFLLPCNKLIIKGDDFKNERNFRAEWLGLPHNFDGTFTFFPQQKQIAFYGEFKHDLGKYIEVSFFKNFWFGMAIAAQFIENELKIRQRINKTTNNKTIIDSFNSDSITAGKLFNSRSVGFSDLRFKFGTELSPRGEDFQINAQTYLLVPLENTESAEILFPATRGFNGHWGIGSIVNLQIPITKKCSPYLVAFCLDIEDLFLFKNHQERIFDLNDKPLSRYLLLNNINGDTNIPAINILTQKVKVEPFNLFDLSVGFRYKRNCLEAELTYGLWGHGHEKIKLKHKKFPKTFGIAAAPGQVTAQGIPATASKSTISKLAQTDKNENGQNIFIPIKKDDINLCSGSSQGTLVHRINLAIGSTYKGETLNALWSFGGFVEIPQNNCALEQWGFWCKIGATF